MKLMKKILMAMLITIATLIIFPVVMPVFDTGYTVQAASVKINKTKYTMNKGEKYTLKVTGTKKKITWSTSDKKVATVDSKGKVTAKKKGTVTITAKVGSKKYKCKITVESPKLNVSKKTIYKGKTYTLKLSGTKRKISWSSSSKSVATVNSKGKVTAKKKGTATITAKVGNKKYTCKVTVKNPGLNVTKKTIYKGSTYTLKVQGVSGKVTWSTSNKEIANVSSKGVITTTGKSSGYATITAKVNGKKYKCEVLVEYPSINLNSLGLYIGESYNLKIYGARGKATWSSSNKSVATVSSKGKVTAKKAGKTTIKVKDKNGTFKCDVLVGTKDTALKVGNVLLTYGKYEFETSYYSGLYGTINLYKDGKFHINSNADQNSAQKTKLDCDGTYKVLLHEETYPGVYENMIKIIPDKGEPSYFTVFANNGFSDQWHDYSFKN